MDRGNIPSLHTPVRQSIASRRIRDGKKTCLLNQGSKQTLNLLPVQYGKHTTVIEKKVHCVHRSVESQQHGTRTDPKQVLWAGHAPHRESSSGKACNDFSSSFIGSGGDKGTRVPA